MDTFYVKYTHMLSFEKKYNKKNKKTKNGSREKAWPLESYTIGFLTLHTNVNF